MSLLKRFAELYLNQPMLLSAGLLPELAYPVASWRYAEVVPVAKAPVAIIAMLKMRPQRRCSAPPFLLSTGTQKATSPTAPVVMCPARNP